MTLTRAPRSGGESGVVAGALRWENRDVVENRLGGSWFQPDGSDLLYHPLDFMVGDRWGVLLCTCQVMFISCSE